MLTLERPERALARSPTSPYRQRADQPSNPTANRQARRVGLAGESASRPPLECALTAIAAPAPESFVDKASIDPLVLKWMPVAVPMAAVLLCACIGVIWTLV